jgi:hypothetical protein
MGAGDDKGGSSGALRVPDPSHPGSFHNLKHVDHLTHHTSVSGSAWRGLHACVLEWERAKKKQHDIRGTQHTSPPTTQYDPPLVATSPSPCASVDASRFQCPASVFQPDSLLRGFRAHVSEALFYLLLNNFWGFHALSHPCPRTCDCQLCFESKALLPAVVSWRTSSYELLNRMGVLAPARTPCVRLSTTCNAGA